MGVTYSGNNLIAATLAWWNATPSAQALTASGQLWHVQAPEDAALALPYATVFRVSETNEVWTTRFPFRRTILQFNFHGATDVQASTAAETFRGLFQGAPLAVGSSAIAHCLPADTGLQPGEALGPGGRDCWVATETFDIAWTP